MEEENALKSSPFVPTHKGKGKHGANKAMKDQGQTNDKTMTVVPSRLQ